jgi:hypothetical protein
MPERERRLVDEPGLGRERELARDERAQPLGGHFDIRVQERRDGAEVEHLPFHCRALDSVPLRRRQPIEAGRQESAQARRDSSASSSWRSRAASSCANSGLPHTSQNPAPTRFSCRHAGHVVTVRVYGVELAGQSAPPRASRVAPSRVQGQTLDVAAAARASAIARRSVPKA